MTGPLQTSIAVFTVFASLLAMAGFGRGPNMSPLKDVHSRLSKDPSKLQVMEGSVKILLFEFSHVALFDLASKVGTQPSTHIK